MMTYAIPYHYPQYHNLGDPRIVLTSHHKTTPNHHNVVPTSPGVSPGFPIYQPWHWQHQPSSPFAHYNLPTQVRPNVTNSRTSPTPQHLALPTNHQPQIQPTHFPTQNNSMASTPPGTKRGRPRADIISTLQYVGSNSNSAIRCQICHRVFPREKSLQAHLRTHTGERPYRCDYPKCPKSFVQSGQLKTHQRLHSGEKPFLCSGKDCTVRFTHANRHCPEHPYAKLQRDDEGALKQLIANATKHDPSVASWLEKYIKNRLDRTNSTQKTSLKREYSDSGSDDESVASSEVSDSSQNSLKLCSSIENDQSDASKVCNITPDRSSGHLTEDETPIVEKRKVLTPKRMNLVAPEVCQPMKKRILAYTKLQEEQENIDVSKHGLPPLSSISLSKIMHPIKHNSIEATTAVSSDCDSASNKCSVIVRRKSVIESGNERNEQAEKCVPKPKDELQNRWNSALALIQLASSPPSKRK